jgi:carotenoid cleavage dioxygenase
VDQEDIEEWSKRRAEGGEVGPAKAAQEPLTWQMKEEEEKANTTNGVPSVDGRGQCVLL